MHHQIVLIDYLAWCWVVAVEADGVVKPGYACVIQRRKASKACARNLESGHVLVSCNVFCWSILCRKFGYFADFCVCEMGRLQPTYLTGSKVGLEPKYSLCLPYFCFLIYFLGKLGNCCSILSIFCWRLLAYYCFLSRKFSGCRKHRLVIKCNNTIGWNLFFKFSADCIITHNVSGYVLAQ